MRVDIDGLFQTLEDSLDLFLGLYLEDHQLVVSLGLEELVEVVTDAQRRLSDISISTANGMPTRFRLASRRRHTRS